MSNPADPALIADLVAANRILYERGVVDGFGHVSVRHDRDPERFLLARNMAPALVTADDVMTFALDGTPIDDERPPYLERFIHGAIFRARRDVGAVVHSHSPAVIPFGVVPSATMRPVFHMAGFLGAGVPVFEIRDAAGPASDMLVRSDALGTALAGALGPHAVVLMRGHGSTAVGADLPMAVYRAVYTEVNARLEAEALRLGPVTFLNEAEAAAASSANAGQIARAWALWKRAVS